MATYTLVPGLTGVQTDFTIPFDYLSKSHVFVSVNGVLTSFTWNSTYVLKILPAPVGTVLISRITPSDEPLNTFTDGSVLIADDLNGSFLQNLFIAQENRDSVFGRDVLGNWDVRNLRLINVTDPVEPKDATNKQWVQTFMGGSVSAAASSASSASSSASAAAASAADALASKNAAGVSAGSAAASASGAAASKTATDALLAGVTKWEHIGTYNPGGASVLIVQNLGEFKRLRISGMFRSLTVGGEGALALNYSADNGTTFITTADHWYELLAGNAAVVSVTSSVTYPCALITPFAASASNDYTVFSSELHGFNYAAQKINSISAHGKGSDSGLRTVSGFSQGSNSNGAVACNAIKLFPTAGVFGPSEIIIEGIR